jgi:deazaflavin-dependent oxidoreductase (nitroreductase family)
MNDQPVTSSAPRTVPGQQARTPGAQALRAQRLVNRMVRGLLRTPLLSRALGRRLVTLYIIGRKSGQRYTIPVAYTRHEGSLLIGTSFGWGRNLRTGEPVDVRLRGRLRQADVSVLTGEPEVTAAYAVMCRDNRQFAKFNQIGYDAGGAPNPEDLHRAWTAGARAFRLIPR